MRRWVQDVDGYELTMGGGEITYLHGEPTGALPGGLMRNLGLANPVTNSHPTSAASGAPDATRQNGTNTLLSHACMSSRPSCAAVVEILCAAGARDDKVEPRAVGPSGPRPWVEARVQRRAAQGPS